MHTQVVAHANDTSLELLYIDSGSCSAHVEGFHTWKVNNGWTIQGMMWPTGSFISVSQFLLGTHLECDAENYVVKACTDRVVVRRLKIARNKAGCLPLEVCVVYVCTLCSRYVYACVYVHVYVCMYVCMYICMYVCMYVWAPS